MALAIVLPFNLLGSYLGFVAPLLFFLILAGMVIIDLLAVESVKQ